MCRRPVSGLQASLGSLGVGSPKCIGKQSFLLGILRRLHKTPREPLKFARYWKIRPWVLRTPSKRAECVRTQNKGHSVDFNKTTNPAAKSEFPAIVHWHMNNLRAYYPCQPRWRRYPSEHDCFSTIARSVMISTSSDRPHWTAELWTSERPTRTP